MDQDRQKLLEDFITVIKDLTDVAGHISRIEENKAQAASLKRHELLDGYIQKEQALILKLRGLEQHRIRLAKSLGWDSLTFRQILEKAPAEERQMLAPLFQELDGQLSHLKGAKEAAEKIINVRIHELQVAIARSEGSSYDNSGSMNISAPRPSKMRDTYV